MYNQRALSLSLRGSPQQNRFRTLIWHVFLWGMPLLLQPPIFIWVQDRGAGSHLGWDTNQNLLHHNLMLYNAITLPCKINYSPSASGLPVLLKSANDTMSYFLSWGWYWPVPRLLNGCLKKTTTPNTLTTDPGFRWPSRMYVYFGVLGFMETWGEGCSSHTHTYTVYIHNIFNDTAAFYNLINCVAQNNDF